MSNEWTYGKFKKIYGYEISQAIRIQYGGSINRSNISEFIVQTEIDGMLIGGASLSVEEFEAILTAVYRQTASD